MVSRSISGRGAAWLARLLGVQEVPSSNLGGPTKFLKDLQTTNLRSVALLPLLTIAADFIGIVMAWITAMLSEPISLRFFFETGFKDATFSDLIPPIMKTSVFGAIIGLVASFQGMRTHGGTEGVGRTATSSVVLSSLFVILADVVLVRLTLMIWPFS